MFDHIEDEILKEYFEKLKLSGCLSNQKYTFNIFFDFLHERQIPYHNLNVNNAQDFQTCLMTLTDKEGNIYYTKETVITMINRIIRFYNYLKQKKIIRSNPFAEIKKIKAGHALPKNIPDEENLDKLLLYFKEFWKAGDIHKKRRLYKVHVISELMYSTGMRMNEVKDLKIEDIDFENGTVKIKDTKSSQERIGILNEYTGRILKIYIKKMREEVNLKNTDYIERLFGSNSNIYKMVNNTLKEACKEVGLKKMTSHCFRHCVGYHLLRSGCDIRYIQEILGHKSLNSTQIYTKVDREDLKHVLDKYHPRQFKREDKTI